MLRLRLTLEGDRIVTADPVIGYVHRGAEKLFEARDYRQIIVLANRHDWLSAFSSELGVVLAAVGLYGLLSSDVTRRTAEIGIRVALGARRQDVLWLVMKEGAKFSFAGIALGLAGAMLVTRLLASELYGVNSMDAMTYCSVTGAMAAVTLLACYVPTRRAMRLDPMVALRYE